MHALKPGPANRSFGLQVAALAGLPRSVFDQAQHTLRELEGQRSASSEVSREALDAPLQMGLFYSPAPALAALAAIEPDELTTKPALEALYGLKGMSYPVADSAAATPAPAHPGHPGHRTAKSRRGKECVRPGR